MSFLIIRFQMFFFRQCSYNQMSPSVNFNTSSCNCSLSVMILIDGGWQTVYKTQLTARIRPAHDGLHRCALEMGLKNSAECSARQCDIRPKFGRTSANIRRHLSLPICGLLHSPLALTKVNIITCSALQTKYIYIGQRSGSETVVGLDKQICLSQVPSLFVPGPIRSPERIGQ